MKALRIIGNVIIGIIIFSLLFSLILISKTKNLIEGEILQNTIKNTIEQIEKNDNSLTESQKKVVDDMFNDGDVGDIINLVLQNYKDYKNKDNYSVSYDDAMKFYNFVVKYKSYIKSNSEDDISKMSEKEFKDYFNDKKVDKFVIDAFSEFDKNFDKNTLDVTLKVYSFATSTFVKVIIIFVIIAFIMLLCLINWDFIKWMVVFGIDLIISGFLFVLIYLCAEFAKEMILIESADIKINFNSFLISGIVQLFSGIIIIIGYSVIKKKFFKNKKEIVEEVVN